MSQPSYFPESYQQARLAFRAAAQDAGAELFAFCNDGVFGPDGEALCTDVARLGPAAPESVIMLVSGTHGVEGFAGSACQLGFLREALLGEAPSGTAALLVHALNPYGFAHQRRVNEDNVDLNRNFVDHADPPHNSDYDLVHAALVPTAWEGEQRQAADQVLVRFAAECGMRRLQTAVTRGQYRHPDGLFYGGVEPVWSNRLLRRVVRELLPASSRLAYIDLHTGLGEPGMGEPIFRGGRDPDALNRVRGWYGSSLTTSEDGTSSSTPIIGNTATLVASQMPAGCELTAITLEFGTLPSLEVLTALRADNWLHLQPAPPDAVTADIKRQIRAAFYPSEPQWRDAVWTRANEVFGQAFKGLAAKRSSG